LALEVLGDPTKSLRKYPAVFIVLWGFSLHSADDFL